MTAATGRSDTGKERATAEIVADLRRLNSLRYGMPLESIRMEAADRLVELDAEVAQLLDAHKQALSDSVDLRRVNELRLPCPHPGCVNGAIMADLEGEKVACSVCPDCVDGLMSWERMAKIVAAVQTEIAHYDEHYPNGSGLTEVGRACRELVNRVWSVR